LLCGEFGGAVEENYVFIEVVEDEEKTLKTSPPSSNYVITTTPSPYATKASSPSCSAKNKA